MSILAVDGLVKSYSRRRVVDGVSMHVQPGEIVGLLGPNGAGKSTCFKMICGLVTPDHGEVHLQGQNVTTWPLHRRSREGGMGYLPQQSSLFTKLSVDANLRGVMQLLGFSRKRQRARLDDLLDQFNIRDVRRNLAGTLSGGERRRLEIARCLVAEPKIIMLDEPFAAIDPVTVQSIQAVIKELAGRGISILITDHAAREILQITDRTYVVSDGRILCSGTAEEIVAHEQVKREYLGDIDIVMNQPDAARPTNSKMSISFQPRAAALEDTPAAGGTSEAVSSEGVSNEGVSSPAAKRKPLDSPKVPRQSILSLMDSADAAEDQSEDANAPDRPRIVFSKPRRRNNSNVAAPFKSTDLD